MIVNWSMARSVADTHIELSSREILKLIVCVIRDGNILIKGSDKLICCYWNKMLKKQVRNLIFYADTQELLIHSLLVSPFIT